MKIHTHCKPYTKSFINLLIKPKNLGDISKRGGRPGNIFHHRHLVNK